MAKVKLHCNKCQGETYAEIGSMTLEEVREKMRNIQGFHCDMGLHVEIGRMSDYYEIVPDSLVEDDTPILTDEEWQKSVGEYTFYTSDQATAEFEFHGFGAPFVSVTRRSTGIKCTLEFAHAPSGTRYYWVIKEE